MLPCSETVPRGGACTGHPAGDRRRARARLPALAGRAPGACDRAGRRTHRPCPATGAAFGVARLIFQGGYGASFLGFQPQGFLDAWGPVFFFAMIFAIAMDYTVFLLASAKEHHDRSGDPRDAMIGGVAHSGRVILAAAAAVAASSA